MIPAIMTFILPSGQSWRLETMVSLPIADFVEKTFSDKPVLVYAKGHIWYDHKFYSKEAIDLILKQI